MRAFKIDYQRNPKSSWARWALLVIPMLLGMDLIQTRFELEQRLGAEAGERRPNAIHARATGTGQSRDDALAVSFDHVEGIFKQLTFPWSSLFRSLEEAHTDEVALLSVQPDAQRRTITLVGEAKAYADVLAYVARLRQEATFANVHLVGTETKENHAQRPLLFTVSAAWKILQ